jgi:hypothetical protein
MAKLHSKGAKQVPLISQCRQLSDARSSSGTTSRLLTTSLPPSISPGITPSFEPRPPLRLSRKQDELSGIILLAFQSANLTFVSMHCGKAN